MENDFQKNDKVFLVGLGNRKFKNRFSLEGKHLRLKLSEKKKKNILAKIGSSKILEGIRIFIRIDSLNWLRKISFREIDFLILKLTRKELAELDFNKGFMQKNLRKIIVELPKFIPEERLEFYRKICREFYRKGARNFMLSQISQKNLLTGLKGIKLFTNENVYSLNDAAVQFLKEESVCCYIYPTENDYPNLISGKDRMGIIPLYFYPELFYSRMPVSVKSEKTKTANLKDRSFKYKKVMRDGISIVVPEIPVSLLQYKDKLYQKGFRRFLIDFSHVKPSQNIFKKILRKLHYSETEQPSSSFNFKMGLK
jgi:putative protease